MSLRLSYRPFRVKMAELGLSRKELEQATGINKNTIGRLYNDIDVSVSTLKTVCEYLNCGIADVVEFLPETPTFDERVRGLSPNQKLSLSEAARRLNPKYRNDNE